MSITVATIVKNEAANFLPRALECWKAVADRIVAVDNGSTDGTKALLEAAGAEVHSFETPMDGYEATLRAYLWETALESAEDGDWLVWLDADHVLAGDPRPFLAETPVNRVLFTVYDMWTPTAFRSDAWWRVRPWWQGVRMVPEAREFAPWTWPNRGWHSGHVPLNVGTVFGPTRDVPTHAGLLHYGYATPELRERHHAAYQKRAHLLTASEQYHASTILDERPRLVALPFELTWRL